MFDNIQNRIERIINKIKADKDMEIKLETDFFRAGVLDSFGMIEYLCALEKEFDINISNEDLIPQNFGNIKVGAQMVRKYLSKKDGSSSVS